MALPLLAHLPILSYPIPAGVGTFRYTRLDRTRKVLTWLVLCSFAASGSQYCFALFKLRNHFISEYFRILEVGLFTLLFYVSVSSQQTRRILIFFMGGYTIIWLLQTATTIPVQFNEMMAVLSRSVILVMSLLAAHSELANEKSQMTERPLFWICAASITYASGTLLMTAFADTLMSLGRDYFLAGWHINWILGFIANLLYTKALICKSPATA